MYSFTTRDKLEKFLQEELVNTSEAAELLGCSRQNVHRLVKEGRLHPIKSMDKDRIFWKADILARVKPSE